METVVIVKGNQALKLRPPPQSLIELKEACNAVFGEVVFRLQVRVQRDEANSFIIESTKDLLNEYAKCSDSLTLELMEEGMKDYRLLTNSLEPREDYEVPTPFFHKLGRFLVYFANSTDVYTAARQFDLPLSIVKSLQSHYSKFSLVEPNPIRRERASKSIDIVETGPAVAALLSGTQSPEDVCNQFKLSTESLDKWIHLLKLPLADTDWVNSVVFSTWTRRSLLEDYLLGRYTPDELNELFGLDETDLALWMHYELKLKTVAKLSVSQRRELQQVKDLIKSPAKQQPPKNHLGDSCSSLV